MKKFLAILLSLATVFGVMLVGGADKIDAPATEIIEERKYIGEEPVDFPDSDVYLVKNNASEYKVVIPAAATKSEKYAAEELVYFMERSTNCKLPIISDSDTAGDKFISVGNTTLLGATDIVVDYEELGKSGVIVNTKGNSVYLCGATDYGTLFSVYRFLHYQIGYEAYAYDHIEHGYYAELKLKNFDYKYKPTFGVMTAEDGEMSGESKTKEALRMNIFASKNGGYDLSGGLFNGLWCHTMWRFVDKEAVDDTVKEVDKDGNEVPKKLWRNGQVCFSSETTFNYVTKALTERYVNSASGPYLMLGIEDGTGYCDCKECLANEKIYGGTSGVYMRFLNRVAEYVENYMKENGITKKITLVGFAYYSYIAPPLKTNENGEYLKDENGKCIAVSEEVVPRDGQVSVGVMFTPISSCYSHPLGDEKCEVNAPYMEYLKGWADITKHLMMYSYGTDFHSYKFHFNNWGYEGDTFRYLASLGMEYYFEQACADNGISPMSSLRVYVRSKLAWNPNYDTQYLIDEFMTHYYGDGAKGVKEYFETVMENFQRIYSVTEEEHVGIYDDLDDRSYWTRPILLDMESYLEKATNAVRNGKSVNKEVYEERIFREYFLLKDTEQMWYKNYLSESEQAELAALVDYGREKYNAYKSAE